MLERVTIAGADENTNPEDLLGLTRKYPFVEWGILRSMSQGGEAASHYNSPGSPRYPNMCWREKFYGMMCRNGYSDHMSAHVCGTLSRMAMAGDLEVFHSDACRYSRWQFNGSHQFRLPGLLFAQKYKDVRCILQANSIDSLQEQAMFIASTRCGVPVDLLFDPSGGTGVTPDSWPSPPVSIARAGFRIGYSGAIGPHNVEAVLRTLEKEACALPFWIDMESLVRTSDRLDLEKVETVLRLSEPFVRKV